LKGIKVDEKVVYADLLKKLKGYSGADVANVCRDAAMMPMRKKLASGEISITEMAKMDQSELDVPITM
jgi:katanin p60 ATPase-containing subunit A1